MGYRAVSERRHQFVSISKRPQFGNEIPILSKMAHRRFRSETAQREGPLQNLLWVFLSSAKERSPKLETPSSQVGRRTRFHGWPRGVSSGNLST